jgi:NTP pyrophosphatase (non-canonical NTP hydrolase)
MNFNEYQQETKRTAPQVPVDEEVNLLVNFALGTAGEGGEIADYIKKVVFHGHPLDKTKLANELGDELWYIARLADLLGFTLEEIAAMNVEKLRKRYPNGFSEEDSRNRVV